MPVYLPGLTFGTGYGGAPYAHSPYGGVGYLSRTPVPVTGGFGGYSYSTSSYGSVGNLIPKVSSAISLSGFSIRVFFNEEMAIGTDLVDPSNYNIISNSGVPVVVESISVSTTGKSGATAITITHSGTTLGGSCTIVVTGISSVGGVVITPPNNEVSLFVLGETPSLEVTHVSEDQYRLSFKDSLMRPQELLTEAEFSPGSESVSSYDVRTAYPIKPPVDSATLEASLSDVLVEMPYTTKTSYEVVAGPATAIDYTGNDLPEDSPEFTGVQIGVGEASLSFGQLLLSKVPGDRFGYSFGDTSGKVLPNSTINASITFDLSSAIHPPILDGTFATFSVSDGVVEITVVLRATSGMKFVEVVSGAYSTQFSFDWGTTSCEISVIRNQKANFYAILCNGYPEVSFNTALATGVPTYGPGLAFVLGEDIHLKLLPINRVLISSSQTLFTKQWNFLHSVIAPFIGAGVFTRNVIQTKRGPLVRGWGDNTAAKKEDVAVRVDGVEVEVASINPYLGEIYPLIPIPLFSPGTFSVEVDYIWFQNPALPILGLNTQGLTLNTWDRVDGHTDYPKPEPEIPTGPYGLEKYKDIYGGASYPPTKDWFGKDKGVTKTNRFPMGIMLGPGERKSPKKIGHRYVGFQNEYSALLNNQSLLLLNKNPHSISEGSISAEGLVQKGLFNGREHPSTSWNLSGVETGNIIGDGTYRLIDSSSGSYRTGYEALYSRPLDLSLDCMVTGISRFKVETYSLDGVFTGVGFGLYDGSRLGLIGALVIDGVQHFGLLLDGNNPHIESSWKIGFEYTAGTVSQTVITIPFNVFPNGVEAGDRLRVASGTQKGVYKIAECGINLNGSLVEITLETSLPGNISIPGNNTFQVFFETIWDTNLCSFRIVSEFPTGTVDIYFGSEISGLFLSNQELIPYPAQTALLIPAEEKGSFFWGSISRKATNSSVWDIVQYVLTPREILNTITGLYNTLEMDKVPRETADYWYEVSGFGSATASGSILSLESNSSSTDKDTSFYYQKVEPFISNKVETDLESRLKVLSGNSSGDATIEIRDSIRTVVFKTLRYIENGTGRALLSEIPTTSLSGLLSPELEGWTNTTPVNVSTSVTGQILTISKTGSQSTSWYRNPTYSGINPEGFLIHLDCKLSDTISGSKGVGFSIKVDVVGVLFYIVFDTGVIRLEDSFGTTIFKTFAYAWDDGNFHKYKLSGDPVTNTATLLADGVLVGTLLYTDLLFGGSVWGSELIFSGSGSCTVSINSFSMTPFRSDPNEKRTFGVLVRGGDANSIDGYRIPRLDSTSAKNSSLSASVLEMDWTSFVEVRLFLDPLWGLSFYRPDLNFPDGSPYVPGNTDPLNAYINVEYSDLPRKPQGRGSISFGSINPYSVSEQEWDYLRYRVRTPPNGYGVAPTGMVLNRATKLTSGEFLFDKTLEDENFTSRTPTLIYVPDSGKYADRVFQVFVDGVLQSSTTYSFDKFTQYITLTSPLTSNRYPVRVVFAIGQPITKKYLCEEPISNSVTLLNEGTPPVPKSDTQNYSDKQFCEVSEGDSVSLSSICDGPGPGKGLSEIGIEGHFTTGAFEVPHGPGGVWGKSSPTYKGSSTHHGLPIFYASGGNYTGPTLSPGSMMLYPNQQVPKGHTGMGINQDFTLRLESVTPYEEVFVFLDDDVPPQYAEPVENNPDDAPSIFGNGAAAFLEEDYGTSVSRLGPWGGLSSLENSLLGGGSQLTGVEFTLQGGTQIARPVRTSGVLEATS